MARNNTEGKVIWVRAPKGVHAVIIRGNTRAEFATHEVFPLNELATFEDLVNQRLLQEVQKHFGKESYFEWVDDGDWRKLTALTGKARIFVCLTDGDSLPYVVKRCGPIVGGLEFHLPIQNDDMTLGIALAT